MARRGYAERPVMPHAVGSVGVVAVQNGFVRTIDWRGAHIEAIDQIRLPGELVMPERVNGTGHPIGLSTRTQSQPCAVRAVKLVRRLRDSQRAERV